MFVDKKEVGQRIYDIRKTYGYSMEKFGELIDNAPKGSVNSWEKGVNLPNENRLEQIARLGNISTEELLYGSLEEYVCKLVNKKYGLHWVKEDIELTMSFINNYGYSYGDDIEILQLMDGLVTYHEKVTKDSVIFYQPKIHSKVFQYFDGLIQNKNGITLVCHAFSDKEKNTLHILPDWDDKINEERINFSHSIEKLNLQHFHTYFTAGIPMLALKIEGLQIIYYGVNQKDFTPQIIAYKYNSKTDSFTVNKRTKYSMIQRFYREAEKEALYQKHKSK